MSVVKKGVRIWTCDGCGKRETWRNGWHYFPGCESPRNVDPTGKLIFPASVCSDACADTYLKEAIL